MRRLIALVVALLIALPLALAAPTAHPLEVHAAMATTTVIPDGTYNAGTFTLPHQTALAGEAYDVRAIGTLVQPVTGTNFLYQLFVSYDGGTTWTMPSQAACAGGLNAKTGQLVTITEDVDTQFSGPAIWYVQVSFAKRLTLQNVSATVTTTP